MGQVIVDDILLREPNLLVPGKKPIGPVEVKTSSIFADKLVDCWSFPSLQGIKGRVNGTWSNSPVVPRSSLGEFGAFSSGGQAAASSSAQGAISLFGQRDDIIVNRDFSVMSICIPQLLLQDATVFSFGVDTIELRINTAYNLMAVDANIANIATTSNATASNKITFIGWSIDSGDNYLLYLNGVTGASGTTTANFANVLSPSQMSLNALDYKSSASTYNEFGGILLFTAYWQRALTEADFDSLYRDSYQFLTVPSYAGLRFIGAAAAAPSPTTENLWMSWF